MKYSSIYSPNWDVVIFGAGYAGFAAAMALRRAGKKVLLTDRRAALLSEGGWAFASEAGHSVEPLWQEWMGVLEKRHAAFGGQIDGAIAEVLATDLLTSLSIPVLYYAAPMAVSWESGLLTSVVMGGKSGLHRLSASQWIDATDEGELVSLLDPDYQRPATVLQTLSLYFRVVSQAASPSMELGMPALLPEGTQAIWEPGVWSNERRLKINLPGDFKRSRDAWLPALKGLHDSFDLKNAVLSHGSVVPFRQFESRAEAPTEAPNVITVGAEGGSSLAGRFGLGIRASKLLSDQPMAKKREGDWEAISVLAGFSRDVEVAVAGLGTGCAVAALAAARGGARVLAFDPQPFSGGIGAGGGVHVYYFGVKGGLQEEIDARIRAIMPLFGSPAQVGGFHPDAKKIVLDEMLLEAGVDICHETSLVSVVSQGGIVENGLVSTTGGPVRLRATTWVDATGDGDLSAMAGASFRLGRNGDGLLHAYSQSSGRVSAKDNSARMQIVNFDSGFCDPTDEEDLTRARLLGMAQYVQERYDEEERPTYLAPAIGLRQSRHIVTDYTLSLDDLIRRRQFSDAVGYTGGHYDNHARDYEFESAEAAFWVWVCHQWYGRLACEIPYGILLPRRLRNVVLACRAVGVSEEAHHSLRMQRDMQRVGEAAGTAVALAVREGVDCRNVSYERLKYLLMETGALCRDDLPDTSFGHHADGPYFQYDQGKLDRWLEEMKAGPATEALWHLYQAGDSVRDQIVPLLHSEDKTVSWRAAAILAMWGDQRAEGRLGSAIRDREDDKIREITKPQQEWFYVPRWYSALTFLRRCATQASLPLLEKLAKDGSLLLNLRTAVALACESLAFRVALLPEERLRILMILETLIATDAPRTVRTLHDSIIASSRSDIAPNATDRPLVLEDYSWQLHYAVAKARIAIGESPQENACVFLSDPRAIVRRTMAGVFASEERSSPPP